jgi:hypothetical protein
MYEFLKIGVKGVGKTIWELKLHILQNKGSKTLFKPNFNLDLSIFNLKVDNYSHYSDIIKTFSLDICPLIYI